MNKRVKMGLGIVAGAATLFVLVNVSVQGAKMLSGRSHSKKLEQTAKERGIELQTFDDYYYFHGNDRDFNYERDGYYAGYYSFMPQSKEEKFEAQSDIVQRIRKNLSLRAWEWKLDKNDTIEVDEKTGTIIYTGNAEGSYTIVENAYTEDGMRKRNYTQKSEKNLAETKRNVEKTIGDVLSDEQENLREKFPHIQVTLTSEPHFERFLQRDYDYFIAKTIKAKKIFSYYALLLAFYALVCAAFFGAKSRVSRSVLCVLALVVLSVFVRLNIYFAMAFLFDVIIVHSALAILTAEKCSRATFFVVLGLLLGLSLKEVSSPSSYGMYATNELLDAVAVLLNIAMCAFFADSSRRAIDAKTPVQTITQTA